VTPEGEEEKTEEKDFGANPQENIFDRTGKITEE